MGDNLRRVIQDIDLGANDSPITLPVDVVNEAAAENRFILIGRPVIPRRQNICSIIANLPRIWGQEGFVHGRIIDRRRFQFVFSDRRSSGNGPSPWSMGLCRENVGSREMDSQFKSPMLNYIPFWMQIRGIPFQYLSLNVVTHIGRCLGLLMEIDYNAEASARREYVRVRFNWNIDQPLRFHKQFQFIPGVNTLLRITYERLGGFCEVCGMLTHDSGACLIQNEGPHPHNDDDDDKDSDEDAPNPPPNSGIRIEEIHDEVQNAEENPPNEANQSPEVELPDNESQEEEPLVDDDALDE